MPGLRPSGLVLASCPGSFGQRSSGLTWPRAATSNTCIIVQNDQQPQPTKRNRQPSCKFSGDPPPIVDFDNNDGEFNSAGPLTNAITIAPPTQMTVPIILAMPFKL
ncbi:hypothetical protein PanWU01x14_237060 [Parasponia andersonii]|uniref:Uncharacterized protein n=1 Tax=Parasponia andersonii TaxID=3476 RepID=A0A2P5BI28_PARAD|nr:hypothetical protein PanWU01x14_237060 [Parasponia andersonii]